jgi:hypothetical protein
MEWTVLGMAADTEEQSFIPADPFGDGEPEQFVYDSADDALLAARDFLTYFTERRTTGMQGHFLPYLRSYVEDAERRGYDRQAVVKNLVSLLERHAVNGRPRASDHA